MVEEQSCSLSVLCNETHTVFDRLIGAVDLDLAIADEQLSAVFFYGAENQVCKLSSARASVGYRSLSRS